MDELPFLDPSLPHRGKFIESSKNGMAEDCGLAGKSGISRGQKLQREAYPTWLV